MAEAKKVCVLPHLSSNHLLQLQSVLYNLEAELKALDHELSK